MSELVQDLRYGWRTLRKAPVFLVIATMTLALGIGANSAIFTLIDAALLRPLPFPEPDRLALVWEDTSMFGLRDSPVAIGNYVEWRSRNRVFAQMGALEQRSFRLTGTGEAQQVPGSVVTAGVLEALRVRPALGRLFREDEDQPGTARTVILSDRLWRSLFGGERGAVGRTLEVNDQPHLIVGVMPPGFHFPDSSNEVWAPAGTFYQADEFTNKGRHNAMIVARLKPGVSMAQAGADMRGIARSLEKEFPQTNAGVGAFVAPLRDHFVSDVRSLLVLLGGAVGLVLLIACANVANLLLSRASKRRREIAIRAAIGASRLRVARQLLAENLLLAGMGGLAGLGIAIWGVKFLARMLPAGMAAMTSVTVDARALAFTLTVSLVTSIGFGFAPLLEMLRVDLHQTLKQGGGRRGGVLRTRGVQRGLAVAEVALAFLLATGAALFIQSFARLRSMNPGFRTANILTMKTMLGGRAYADPAKRTAFYREVLRRVESLPGVISAGFTNGIPLVVKGNVNGFQIEGRPRLAAGVSSNANFRVVSPGYFQTIGLPLQAGRNLNPHDTADQPTVALVNEAMQRKFWGTGSALGKRFRYGPERPWITIVGVVGDVRQAGLEKPPRAEMYFSSLQVPEALTGLAVRTEGDPAKMAAAVRREIRAVDRDVPITDLRTMEEVLDREVFQRRAQMLLLALFAGLALLLASLGIYGVLAYLVAQRTQEIGIRMALGAMPRDVLREVVAQGLSLSAAGIALGGAAALLLAELASKMLFGIAPRDPATFGGVAALLLLIGTAASYVPARRAMRVDPILALRDE